MPKKKAIQTYGHSKEVEELMANPMTKIAEAVTGALAMGRKDAILVGGRIVQGALKGKLLMQLGKELGILIKEGKIKEDYCDKKYGFQSLSELLIFIDSEVPDEDRIEVVKKMFIKLNSISSKESEQMLNYQLFKLSMKLSASQIMLLRISYDFLISKQALPKSREEWLKMISEKIGHNIRTIIKQDEEALIEIGLLTMTVYSDRSGISPENARLTDLGIRFCEYLSS